MTIGWWWSSAWSTTLDKQSATSPKYTALSSTMKSLIVYFLHLKFVWWKLPLCFNIEIDMYIGIRGPIENIPPGHHDLLRLEENTCFAGCFNELHFYRIVVEILSFEGQKVGSVIIKE